MIHHLAVVIPVVSIPVVSVSVVAITGLTSSSTPAVARSSSVVVAPVEGSTSPVVESVIPGLVVGSLLSIISVSSWCGIAIIVLSWSWGLASVVWIIASVVVLAVVVVAVVVSIVWAWCRVPVVLLSVVPWSWSRIAIIILALILILDWALILCLSLVVWHAVESHDLGLLRRAFSCLISLFANEGPALTSMLALASLTSFLTWCLVRIGSAVPIAVPFDVAQKALKILLPSESRVPPSRCLSS